MTGEYGEHLRNRISTEDRVRLYSLIGEHRELDIALRRAREELRFEIERENQEAFRENRFSGWTERKAEVREKINRLREAIQDKLAVIGDLVEDLGLLGVDL